jgi:hypothetical protein
MKGYGLPQATYIELLNDRTSGFGKQEDTEDFQIMDMRAAYDDEDYPMTENLKPIDEFIIRNAKVLSNVECDNGLDHWVWNLDKVASGSFPIENIPDHVRDLAEELYYGAGA